MSKIKNFARTAAVATAAAGLTLAGTSAAHAAVVPAPEVIGGTVNLHVDAPAPWQSCFGMLVPPYTAIDLVGPMMSGDILQVAEALSERDDVISLRTRGLISLPGTVPGLPGTLYADNVPPNIYAATVICAGGDVPTESHIHPVVVGNPFEAFGGSVSGSLGG